MNFKEINVRHIAGWTTEQLEELQEQINNVEFDMDEPGLDVFDICTGDGNGKVR